MKLLLIGGGGHVGRIIAPALESRHDCRYFDLKPVAGREERTIVGSVSDHETVVRAISGQGFDCVLYLPLAIPRQPGSLQVEVDANFDVHARDCYRVFRTALEAGVRRLIYASSMSVYDRLYELPRLDEELPDDAWNCYGISKRMGEWVCRAAGQRYPDATIIALRMIMPRSDAQWEQMTPQQRQQNCDQGPNDMRSLYLAAVECRAPGTHILQTTGDRTNRRMPNTRAMSLLNWAPLGC